MRQGFFDLGTGEKPQPTKKRLTKKTIGCDACKLYSKCTSPKMPLIGIGKKKILIIQERPSPAETKNKKSCVGLGYNLLKEIFYQFNINIKQDCWYTYALKCRSEKNPTEVQLNHCRPYLLKEIEEKKPDVIIPLGTDAVKGLLQGRLSGRVKGVAVTNYFGERIPDKNLNCWVCPTHSSEYLLKNKKDDVLYNLWKNHIGNAIDMIKKPLKSPVPIINTTIEVKRAIKYIQRILDLNNPNPVIAFDYETTGIKPHRKGHKIISASFAYENECFSFPFFDDDEFLQYWKKLMLSGKVKKIAHKLDFENLWTYNKLGCWVKNWEWDTCLGSHCINNNKPNGYTGLKFQIYVKFGIIGIDKKVDRYITGVYPGENEKNSNHFNLIQECSIPDLIYYNALDSFYTLKLYEYQKFRMSAHQQKGFKFFIDGLIYLSKIHQEGMKVDIEGLNEQYRRLSKRIKNSEKIIKKSKEVKKWNKEKFNINSNPQLQKLLYEILKYKKPKEGGKTDEKALNLINTDFTNNIIKYRKFKKIRDTYLEQFMRERVENIIHPFFNLHLVKTFRSSSNSPNFQNIPKRDQHAQNIIRSCIIPTPGNRLIEYDYKSIEVCISACYHKDPVMIDYILDSSTDMHRDVALDLFFRNTNNFLKEERHWAKNGFVFPAFYGSSAAIIAPNIWEMLKKPTLTHLSKHGINNLQDFEAHVNRIEYIFWKGRFKIYHQWKTDIWNRYKKTNYIDSYTGFRYFGPMKFTEVTNYQIQGSAFHCLLWTINNTFDKIKKISGRSRICGQVHDCIVVDAHPEDEVEIDSILTEWGTKKIREYWKWIIVPLKLEKEKSKINGSYNDMEVCGLIGG